MSQHVRQLHNVAAYLIERDREQVPQIVREHLARLYPCGAADGFHLAPYLPARERLAGSGAEDRTACDALRLGILEQLAAELRWQQDRADLALERDFRAPALCGFDGDLRDFADADARAADGLNQQRKAYSAPRPCSADERSVFAL